MDERLRILERHLQGLGTSKTNSSHSSTISRDFAYWRASSGAERDDGDASVLTGLNCLPRIVEGDVSLNVRWKVVDDAFLLSEEVTDLPYELATQILGFEYDGVKSMNLHLVQATSWCLAVVTRRVDWRIHAFVDEQKYYCVWVERTAEHEDHRRVLMPRHFFDRYHEVM